MQEQDILTAIERARKGMGQYLEIMAMLRCVDVSKDKMFQRRFNHFYRMRQRSREWYEEYYSFMERRKGNPPRFEESLDYFHAKLGRHEPSFSSKLCATLDPSEPIWDRYVLQNTGHKPPSHSSQRRIEEAKAVFQGIRDWYRRHIQSQEGQLMIRVFDKHVMEHDQITDVKKIDLLLWQTRD